MKLAVLGGTTRIDQHFLRRAVRSGYSIHFLGTNVYSVPQPNLKVSHGAATDVALLEGTLQNAHAVVGLPYAIPNLETLDNIINTMYAHGISRLIVAADLYQAEPQSFEALLKRAGIDWTIVQYTPEERTGIASPFSMADSAVAKYLVQQITDVANLRSALLLSN